VNTVILSRDQRQHVKLSAVNQPDSFIILTWYAHRIHTHTH